MSLWFEVAVRDRVEERQREHRRHMSARERDGRTSIWQQVMQRTGGGAITVSRRKEALRREREVSHVRQRLVPPQWIRSLEGFAQLASFADASKIIVVPILVK